ncbi:DUF397 domain-containing protein [Streptomyces showdoensis]|uniref:Toxin n=1 Tax=Streptomyces showdoensis TaxID=68268 RepID=A0A2P2GUN2_STREW|nr:DUF397 domain-containing protein [Streptomyces showdoensis]KKZ74635.1 toxin [Streptomyces showdoensis]
MASKALDLTAAVWRKSSYSNGDGGDCLEVAEGFAAWRKSSYSNTSGGNCLEVRDDAPGLVPVRDSKRPDGPVLVVPAAAWAPFVAAVKASS